MLELVIRLLLGRVVGFRGRRYDGNISVARDSLSYDVLVERFPLLAQIVLVKRKISLDFSCRTVGFSKEHT